MHFQDLIDVGVAVQPLGKGDSIKRSYEVCRGKSPELFGFGLHVPLHQTRSSYLSSPWENSTMWRSQPEGIFRWPSLTREICVRPTFNVELDRMCRASAALLPCLADNHLANFVMHKYYEIETTKSTKWATKKKENDNMSYKDAMYAHRVHRLKEWMHQNRVNQTDIAKRTGFTRSYISGICTGVKPFGESVARNLEAKLHMKAGLLDAMDDRGLGPVEIWSHPDELPRGVYAMVPRISIALSAGRGIAVDEEEMGPPLAFSEEWIRSKHISSRTNLRICKVSGDSMHPYLDDGDVVLIDLGQQSIVDNSVYCIRYGDELRIKRLCKRFDGGLRIISDNKSYPEEVLSPEQLQHIAVIGRQIWRAG